MSSAFRFARYLNTSESTVEEWETGAKRPCGLALKLRTVVQKHGHGGETEQLAWPELLAAALYPIFSMSRCLMVHQRR